MPKRNQQHHFKLKFQLDHKAFTIIELLVAVLIIGLMAALGVPQYERMQAKARSAEPRVQLGALFLAENNYLAEWNTFSVDLKAVGFEVTGTRLRYVTGFIASGCTNYPTSAPVQNFAADDTWSDGANVNTGAVSASFSPTGAATHPAPVANRTAVEFPTAAAGLTECDGTSNAQVFRANSHGDPKNNITGTAAGWRSDVWTIDHKKTLKHVVQGY